MSYFMLDQKPITEILKKATKFESGEEAENIINQYLWEEGGDLIDEEIRTILPESGRKWKGKKRAAKKAKPFLKKKGNLQVTIHTKNNYHYLYFPDDGSDTIHHVGNQQFMFDGASRKAGEIGDAIKEKVIKRLEEIYNGS